MRALVCLVALGCSSVSVLAQAPARDTPAAAVGTAVIRGRVIAADNRHPLARVEVRAVSGPLKVNKAVLTDANGRYTITELPAGKISVASNKINYVRANYGQTRALGPGTPVDLANGQVLEGINFALQRTGVIAGRILDEVGDPVADVQVMPGRYVYFNGERRLQNAGASASTNDLGEYRVFGIPPGTYVVSATLRNFNMGTDSTDRTAYAPTYYPGTGNISEAQRMTVAAGQTITGINLTLMPIVAARISGVALDSLGRPMTGGFVNLMSLAGMMTSGGGQILADGTFTIGGVTPGGYTLRASPQSQSDEVALMEISVTGSDIADLQVVSAKPSSIRGRVVFEPGSVKPPAATALRLTASHPNAIGTMPGNAAAKDDWTFEIKAGAGRVLIRANVFGAEDWRVNRVVVNDTDVTDSGIDLPANATIENVVVEMTTRHAQISGTVTDAAGALVRDCVVVVFAQDPQRWTSQTRYVVSSRPDPENLFHLRLPAGDYFAVAFEEPDTSTPFNDPDVLNQLRDRAIKISIGDAAPTKLALKLSEPPVF